MSRSRAAALRFERGRAEWARSPYVGSRPKQGILGAIGNTPIVRLTRVFPSLPFRLYAKLEALNPGGSMKDRSAQRILSEGLASGEISCRTVVIESSSGNM